MAPRLTVHFPDETSIMRRALELARRGIGHVEPNPAVGAVIVDHELALLGEGFHDRFGGPHAEIHALAQAGDSARGATLFVTLEPCSHFGKTPPCADAVIRAGIQRVVIATGDPAPHVSGKGIEKLRQAGIDVSIGLLESEAKALIAPFVMKTVHGRPFVHAKWAMTLDGRIASRTGHSQWISNPASRQLVHQLRGQMDVVLVGIGTALKDDPLLTPRPPGPRTPLRVVLDSSARLPLKSQLVQTARQAPVLLCVTNTGQDVDQRCEALQNAGVDILRVSETVSADHSSLIAVLHHLAQRGATNLLVEGGGHVLGSFHDADLIDEVHVFIAPKLVGGAGALSPVLGSGRDEIPELSSLSESEVRLLDGDVYVRGRIARPST